MSRNFSYNRVGNKRETEGYCFVTRRYYITRSSQQVSFMKATHSCNDCSCSFKTPALCPCQRRRLCKVLGNCGVIAQRNISPLPTNTESSPNSHSKHKPPHTLPSSFGSGFILLGLGFFFKFDVTTTLHPSLPTKHVTESNRFNAS